MTSPIARLGDGSSHGGRIVSAAVITTIDGVRVARVGDTHTCPIIGHGTTPIMSGSQVLSVEGARAALAGSVCGCGAIVQASQFTAVSD